MSRLSRYTHFPYTTLFRSGPSGPNTEIFYDRGPSYGDDANDPELYPGGENERYLEVWNLVFSQFNHNPDHTYSPLPNKNIDRKSTRLNSSHVASSYAVFCLKK